MDRRTPILATLTIVFPNGKEQLVSLKNGDSIRVGRESDNDIIIDEASVSRTHASFDCSSYGVVVTDLASLNGTFLNGARLTSMKDLSSGDVIDIGATKITVSLKSVDALQRKEDKRKMTAQLKPVSVSVLVVSAAIKPNQHASAGELDYAMQLWLEKMHDIVYNCGGRSDKTIADTSVALWVGREPEQQAERALRAAQAVCEMGDKGIVLSKSGVGAGILYFDNTAAIASGNGLAGAVGGSDSEHGFTMLGDPLNAAFSIHSEARRLSKALLFDESTSQLVHSGFSTVAIDASLYTLG